jgi:uncharacterized damage-inducible protein DinB
VLFIYERVYADDAIRRKLEHIHEVQRAYLTMLEGKPLNPDAFGKPYSSPEALAASFRDYHVAVQAAFASWTEEWLNETLPVEWFKANKPTRAQAILQVILHGQSHRGQNAARMRELGWKPPTTDFVLWVDKGQPAPDWPH